MASVYVFVPCYNYGRFLRDCVESVLSQEGVDVRVLILDDCSSDDSEQVGRALAAADPRVEYRRHEKNRGHIATYNEGIEWVAGDYCMLLSADDMVPQGSFRRATAIMDAHPSVGFVYGRFVRFTDRTDLVAEPEPTHLVPQIHKGIRWIEGVCRTSENPIANPELLARTSLQKAVGGYSADLPHTADLEMWLRFACRSDVATLDCAQGYYRIHTKKMTNTLAAEEYQLVAHYRDTFVMFFQRDGRMLPESERLRTLACEAVAREALGVAYKAMHAGNREIARRLMQLASDFYPPSRSSRLYARLRLKLALGTWLDRRLHRLISWVRGTPKSARQSAT